MSDWVSLVNLWCQKNGKEQPKYTFNQCNGWKCSARSTWLKTNVNIEPLANKRDAKQACAQCIYEICQEELQIILNRDDCCIIVDGDQRADCWKWLANENVILEGIDVKVYTGVSTPPIQSAKPFEHIIAQSPSRDAADAKILMDLGAFMALKKYKEYILVSSDHILVQVAHDIPVVRSAADLSQLKKLFNALKIT